MTKEKVTPVKKVSTEAKIDTSKRFAKLHAAVQNLKKNHKTLYIVLYALVIAAWTYGVMMLVQLVAAWVLIGVMGKENAVEWVSSSTGQTIYTAVVYVICLVITVAVPAYIFKNKDKLRNVLGVTGLPTWTDLLLAPIFYIASTLVGMLLLFAFGAIFPMINLEQAQEVGYENIASSVDLVLAAIALVVVAPVAEELIFRGWMYGKLRTKMIAVPALLLTSFVFGLVHGQWNVAIIVFAMSAGQCLQREITGTIWSGLFVHMIRNGLAFYMLFVAPGFLG